MIEHLSTTSDNRGLNSLIRRFTGNIVRWLIGIIVVALGLITLLACGAAFLFQNRPSSDEMSLLVAVVGTVLTMVILAASFALATTFLRQREARQEESRQDAGDKGGDDGELFP